MPDDGRALADYMDELQKKIKPFEYGLRQTMLLDGEARYVSWDFSKSKFDTLEILHLTDIQWGHKSLNSSVTNRAPGKVRLQEYLDWVLAAPNRFIVLGGDNIDAGTAISVGSPFEQESEPQGEIYAFVDKLAPYRHRILGYVGGNHERRTNLTFGDAGRLISTLLRIPYSRGKQYLDVHFGDHKPFKISLWHGTGSGQTKGSIANVVYRHMMQGDSQFYLVGHLHQACILPDWRETRNFKTKTMETTKIIGAMSTSFLGSYGTYGEVAGFRASDVMMARAVLYRNGHWEVTLR